MLELARLWETARRVRRACPPASNPRPVLFFNASTRISGLSQNAAFSLLAAWGLRLSGTRVVHLVCRAGMSCCVLGTDENNLAQKMPCGMCMRQSRVTFGGTERVDFTFQCDEALAARLAGLPLADLFAFHQPLPDGSGDFPLGEIVLPSLRWRMRLQSLADDEPTRSLCREFMLSAWNIAGVILKFMTATDPQAAVVFNGTHFPEATAAWLFRQSGLRVITHESGFQPYSGYFVEGEATRYPIVIPPVALTPAQENRLDSDLQKRWQGDFSMAGVKFWSEIHELPEALREKATGFERMVAVFSNVIFDTTQMYANTIFPDMFAWLDELLQVIRSQPRTLFVLRAHPDEARPGKASRESVAMWHTRNAWDLPNLVLIQPRERISSYELVKHAAFVLVYNSTIGLEATLMGIPALAAGQAPFNAFQTVTYEPDRGQYIRRLDSWLRQSRLEVPPERQENARRFIYYRTYRYSLPFGDFLEASQPTGYVRLKKFSPAALAGSPTANVLFEGILHGRRFELNA